MGRSPIFALGPCLGPCLAQLQSALRTPSLFSLNHIRPLFLAVTSAATAEHKHGRALSVGALKHLLKFIPTPSPRHTPSSAFTRLPTSPQPQLNRHHRHPLTTVRPDAPTPSPQRAPPPPALAHTSPPPPSSSPHDSMIRPHPYSRQQRLLHLRPHVQQLQELVRAVLQALVALGQQLADRGAGPRADRRGGVWGGGGG